MNVESAVQAAAPAKASLLRRARGRISAVLVTAAFLVAGAGVPAFASVGTVVDPTDPTGGSGDTFFSSLTTYLQSHLIAAVLTLAVVGVSVSMLLAWGKKAAKSK